MLTPRLHPSACGRWTKPRSTLTGPLRSEWSGNLGCTVSINKAFQIKKLSPSLLRLAQMEPQSVRQQCSKERRLPQRYASGLRAPRMDGPIAILPSIGSCGFSNPKLERRQLGGSGSSFLMATLHTCHYASFFKASTSSVLHRSNKSGHKKSECLNGRTACVHFPARPASMGGDWDIPH